MWRAGREARWMRCVMTPWETYGKVGGCGQPPRCVEGGLSNGTEAKHLRTTPTRTAQRSRRTFRMRLTAQIDRRRLR